MLLGLGQKAESHRLVPFIAAPATFRTHAALRVLACGGCHMHIKPIDKSLEFFGKDTTHIPPKKSCLASTG